MLKVVERWKHVASLGSTSHSLSCRQEVSEQRYLSERYGGEACGERAGDGRRENPPTGQIRAEHKRRIHVLIAYEYPERKGLGSPVKARSTRCPRGADSCLTPWKLEITPALCFRFMEKE